MTNERVAEQHTNAALHLRAAAEESERAAEHYTHGAHEKAAHYAVIANAHLQHAGQYMSDAAKIHAEAHGGNRHAH